MLDGFPLPPAADGEELARRFWAHHSQHGEPLMEAVDGLAELALAADVTTATLATHALFEQVIEPLCDGFTPEGAEIYRRVFARLVCAARRVRACAAFEQALGVRGLRSERDLLAWRPAAPPLRRAADRDAVRTVLVLSRLTLGADVAICAPVLRRVRRLFPDARVALVGGEGAGAVARCVPGVEHVPLVYGRTARLADRLNAWAALCRTVTEALGAETDGHIVLDPDSRLTQLGLLPPVDAARYYHFPSREYGSDRTEPLSVLVRRWLAETFGGRDVDDAPFALPDADRRWAERLRAVLGEGVPVVSASFGVGGNVRKRAGLELEVRLLERIVRRGARVLLARGAGGAELEESERLTSRLAERGVSVLHLPPGRALAGLDGRSPDVVTWQADVGAFLAAVACADAYVGYDSAGQHIAAAFGVPTLSLFLESAGRKHALRWAPRGEGPVRILRGVRPVDAGRFLNDACKALDELLDAGATRRRAGIVPLNLRAS
ncbi:MAG TPA: hypothetical protein VIN61_12805 [Gammaproteobacteria bacterium]